MTVNNKKTTVGSKFTKICMGNTFCEKCGKLEPRKLLPAFRRRAPTPLHNTCKCSHRNYVVPDVDDVPLLLRNVTIEEQRVLSPFDIHCGDYVRMFNGYRQRTGPFRISWITGAVHCSTFYKLAKFRGRTSNIT